MNDSDSADDKPAFSAVPKPDADEGAAPPAAANPRRNWFDMPEGALGFFVLLLLAAACGGLIAVYWPWAGSGSDNAAVADRLSTLETRIGQIAAGQAPKAAAASFEDMQRNFDTLKERIDADEARVSALEKAAGTAGNANAAALKAALDKNTTDIVQLGEQMAKLQATPSSQGASQSPQLAATVAANEKALAALRDDLDVRAKTHGEALDKLGGRVAALEQNAPPADLAQRLDSFALKSGLAALASRVAHLEDQDTAGLMRRAAAVLALADLVRASAREQPFDNELDALRALVPDSPAIADLSTYAGRGVPTVATLAARFHGDIDTILAAERAAQAHNWAQRVWYDLVNLVSVRRVGNVPGNDTEARAARAEFALKNGDLASAVAEVGHMDKPAKQAAAAWLKDAQARLAVNRDARALTNRIVAALAATQEQTNVAPKTPADIQADTPQ